MEEAVFSSVEVLRSWCKPVYVQETPYNAVFTAEELMWSMCRPRLSARKDGESSFLQCGCPVRLVQACLCVRSTVQCRFLLRGGVAKHVEACFSTRKDGESSFHHCESPVKLVQACLCVGSAVFAAEKVLWWRCRPLKVQEKMEKVVFSTVEVLWSWCQLLYAREAPYKAVSTAEEVVWSTCRPV